MDIKTRFPNLSAMWVRWSNYEIKEVSGVAYMMPASSATEIPYSYAEQTIKLVTDGLNLGKLIYNGEDTTTACPGFAREYGLLGLAKLNERLCSGCFIPHAQKPRKPGIRRGA